jgi:hypothetical protein
MSEIIELLIHFVKTVFKLLKPGGVKVVMVVIDQFMRRIIGIAVHAGDCDAIVYCRMFNQIIAEKNKRNYL